MIDCDCPRCGSHSTKAFSVLHRDGVRDARYRRTAWFYFRGAFGVHDSATRGRSQTMTSQWTAPPVPAATRFLQGGGVTGSLILGALLGGLSGIVFALIALTAFAVLSGRRDDSSHARDLERWASTFRCGRCGTVFAVVEREGSPVL